MKSRSCPTRRPTAPASSRSSSRSRGECKTNDEKAIAIYNFMQLSHYHFAYPGEPGGLPVLKEINCYGWSLCGGLHSEESALWRQLGWGWRFVGWDGHTTVEANYDGQWHYLDVFLKFYAWKPDASAPGRTDNCRRRRIDEPLHGTHQERLCASTRPASASMRRTTSSAATATRSTGRPPRCCRCGDELDGVIGGLRDAPSRRTGRRLGGHRPRRPWLLGRRQPGPRLLADQYLGRGARRPGTGATARGRPRTPAAVTRTPATIRASGWCWSRTSPASRPAATPTACFALPPTSPARRCSSRLPRRKT